MIGISSCTEQEVVTTAKENVSTELRTTDGPCGDAPTSNNSNVTILATYTSNGMCCVKIQVNVYFQTGFTLSASTYVDYNGVPAYFPAQGSVTTEVTMLLNQTIYTLCFNNSANAKYLNIGIEDLNGKLIYCSTFINPCN